MKDNIILSVIATVNVIIFYSLSGIEDFVFNFIPPDTLTYIEASELLFDSLKPHPTRPLCYAFLSGLPKLFDPHLTTFQYIGFGIVLNAAAWLGSIILFHKTLRLYFSRKLSFLFGLIPIFLFGGIANIFNMLTESLALFILTSIAYYILRYDQKKKIDALLIAAALLNLLILIRPGFVYAALLGSTAVIIVMARNTLMKYSKTCISLFVISILSIAIQNAAMYREYGKLSTSFIGKITWYQYLGAETYASVKELPFDAVQERRTELLSMLTIQEKIERCDDDIKSLVSSHPTVVLREWGGNITENSTAGSALLLLIKQKSTKPFEADVSGLLYAATKIQNILFTLIFLASAALILIDLPKLRPALILLASMISYVMLTSGISFRQGDRFHYILYPLILILFLILVRDRTWARSWLRKR